MNIIQAFQSLDAYKIINSAGQYFTYDQDGLYMTGHPPERHER